MCRAEKTRGYGLTELAQHSHPATSPKGRILTVVHSKVSSILVALLFFPVSSFRDTPLVIATHNNFLDANNATLLLISPPLFPPPFWKRCHVLIISDLHVEHQRCGGLI